MRFALLVESCGEEPTSLLIPLIENKGPLHWWSSEPSLLIKEIDKLIGAACFILWLTPFESETFWLGASFSYLVLSFEVCGYVCIYSSCFSETLMVH